MRPKIVQAPVEDAFAAEIRFQRDRADDICDGRQPFGAQDTKRRDRRHELRAVDEREAFLGAEHDRLQAGTLERNGARQSLVAVIRFSFADERQRHMRERRKIAAGADGALRGYDRRDAVPQACRE